jgi:hypothetical protein
MFRENQFSQNLYLIYLKKINENKSSYYPEIRTYKQEVYFTYNELAFIKRQNNNEKI